MTARSRTHRTTTGDARRARAGALTFAAALRSAAGPGSAGPAARVAALPRLVRAVISGRYAGATLGRLGLALLGVAYLVSPVDLVPEAVLPLIGLVDDAVLAGWLATMFVAETERFLDWERGDLMGQARDGSVGTVAFGAMVAVRRVVRSTAFR